LRDYHLQNITRAKWIGGRAQGVYCPLCKCEALSSNPSSTKKGKKDKRINSKDLTIVNMYALSTGTPKYIKQILIDLNRNNTLNTITNGISTSTFNNGQIIQTKKVNKESSPGTCHHSHLYPLFELRALCL
jgi:hypothetical protein